VRTVSLSKLSSYSAGVDCVRFSVTASKASEYPEAEALTVGFWVVASSKSRSSYRVSPAADAITDGAALSTSCTTLMLLSSGSEGALLGVADAKDASR
jgi:hypothetical protein